MVFHKRIRILIADDAPTIRELLMDTLGSQPDFEIVAVACNGEQAIELLERHQPDVVTLDLEMPRMGGLEALELILQRRPTPVIVVSSLAQRNAEITLQALDRGAMDYVAKPEGLQDAAKVFLEELPYKIRNMAGADVVRILQLRKARHLRQKVAERAKQISAGPSLANWNRACIVIGVSTGGPPALASLFSALEPPLPPIVVVQHMPQLFTAPFAKRLDSLSSLEIKEACDGDELRPNSVIVAPGGKHLRLKQGPKGACVEVFDGDYVSSHRPSVDVLFKSAASIFGPKCLGLVMTGMGRDGADGAKAIRRAGGFVLGQDEATSDVYGMNKVAFEEGGIDEQVSLTDLPSRLMLQARNTINSSKSSASITKSDDIEKAIATRLAVSKANDVGDQVAKPLPTKLNLCVVDDDHAQLRLLMHRLKNVCTEQLSLFGTSSASEALARIESRNVDILVADLVMPQYSGVDLLRELKRRNICTQALIMTATADLDSLLSAYELGAVDYLLKPLDPTQVDRLVSEAVQRLIRWRHALAGTFRRTRQGLAPTTA